MLEINVSSKSPAALTTALKKIKEMSSSGSISKDSSVHIILEPGIFRESIRYNLPNPLVIESLSGTKADDCVLKADNCESYNKGLINRGVLVFGPNVTKVVLKNFTIENTHVKTIEEGNVLLDSAEALVWNNTSGVLICNGMKVISRQNTLYLKGNTSWTNCYISGDRDYIYGENELSYFEDCEIYTREENFGERNTCVVYSQSLAEKPGFVFKNCRFTGDRKTKSTAYIIKANGKGSASSVKDWDNIALVDCVIDEWYSPELVWDDDMNLEIYPRGNAKNGIREYATRTMDKSGKIGSADTSRRNIMSYTLTEEDYFKGYASRFLILQETPLVGN